MTVGNKLAIALVAAALGALIAPAFAQNGPSGTQIRPDQGMNAGHRGHGMMDGGMMSGGMMARCADMTQTMNNGSSGRPNSQWQKQHRSESD